MKQKIIKWMQDFLEVPNPALGGWAPCPYARAARVKNKIKIIHGEPTGSDIVELVETLDWGGNEAYVFWYELDEIDLESFVALNKKLNEDYRDRDIVVLGDHPESDEVINGVRMNFDHASLQIVQRMSELNRASEVLERQGYYDTWPKDAYDEVVVRRKK